MKIAYTVCNRHQLSHALALADSLKKYHPDRKLFLGWVDRMKLPDLPEWVEAVPAEELELPDWVGMGQRYFDFELVAACKPFFARYLLATLPSCEELAYFSPTTLLFDSLDSVVNASALLQLSPQRLRPIPAPERRPPGRRPPGRLDDKRILNTGMYHSGSWIMHPDGHESGLLEWWCERMKDRAYFNLCEGMCLDQLWLNYLPIYQEGVTTIRKPGWNYGLHTAPGSSFTFSGGKYLVDDAPLVSLDFAGLESYHPIWSDHKELVKDNALWADLRQKYRQALREHRFPDDPTTLPYGRVARVKPNRNLRKRVVRFLNDTIERIETFDWTHN